MNQVEAILEKIAASNKKPRKKKPSKQGVAKKAPKADRKYAGGKIGRDTVEYGKMDNRNANKAYAPDMKPKKPSTSLVSKAKAAGKSAKANIFTPKKLGLIAAGVAGTGALVYKVRQNKAKQQQQGM